MAENTADSAEADDAQLQRAVDAFREVWRSAGTPLSPEIDLLFTVDGWRAAQEKSFQDAPPPKPAAYSSA